MTQAVIDEGTVMVEELDTLVADGAVEGVLAPDDLTVAAEVIKVKTNVHGNVN